jgi:hypothetical protein
MSKVNFRMNASINEVKDMIKIMGDQITHVVMGQPGIGKSSILKMLEEELGTDDYDFIYVDCPVKDMMDIAASIPNHESRSLEYYVSDLFKLGNGKKKVVMLDEFMKAPKLLQVIFTRMMLERTVGDVPLPEGSIVFATSNNTTDGVGDAMLDHAGNRVCKVEMRNPNVDEFNAWAAKHGIARPIRAWAAMNPRAFASYLDGDQDDNPFIFKPSQKGRQFVSPRSLAKCDVFVKRKSQITENSLAVGLAGTIGEAAAKSMAAFIALESKLMMTADVIKSPDTVDVPDDTSALIMMMLEAADYLKTQDDLNAYMKFVNRIPRGEVQSVFFTMMLRTKPKLSRYNQAITNWAAANNYML